MNKQKLLELLKQGVISWEKFGRDILNYLTEEEVIDLVITEEYYKE